MPNTYHDGNAMAGAHTSAGDSDGPIWNREEPRGEPNQQYTTLMHLGELILQQNQDLQLRAQTKHNPHLGSRVGATVRESTHGCGHKPKTHSGNTKCHNDRRE